MTFRRQIPDIPTDTQPVVTSASSGIAAQGVKAAGQIGGQTIKDVQEKRVERVLSQIGDVTSVLGSASEAGAVFGSEGEVKLPEGDSELQKHVDRVNATAHDRFSRIAAAVSQGAMPQQAAALEAESAVRELVNQTPGFGNEIRQKARDLLGFDPTGFALRQIFNISGGSSKAKTALEKQQEKAHAIAVGMAQVGRPVPEEVVQGALAQAEFEDVRTKLANSRLQTNAITSDEWLQELLIERGPDMGSMLVNIAESTKAGGVADPEAMANAAIQQRESDKRLMRVEIGKLGGVAPEKLAQYDARIDAMYQPVLDQIKNNDMSALLDKHWADIVNGYRLRGNKTAPRLTFLNAAFGPQLAGQVFSLLTTVEDPKQRQLITSFDPLLGELLDNGELTQKDLGDKVEKHVTKTLKGEPLDEEDVKVRPITEGMLNDPKNRAAKTAYVLGLGNQGSPIRAASIIALDLRSQAVPEEVDVLRTQFNTAIGPSSLDSTPGSLVNTIAADLANRPHQESMGGVTVDGQGKLVVTSPLFGGGLVGSPFQSPARPHQTPDLKKAQVFVDATKRGWAKEFGVDQGAFPQELADRINRRVAEINGQEQKRVQQAAKEALTTDRQQAPATQEALSTKEEAYIEKIVLPFIMEQETNFSPEAGYDKATETFHPYTDPAGKLTIGFGHLIKPGEDFSQGLPLKEARVLAVKDYRIHTEIAQRNFDTTYGEGAWSELDPNQKAALTDVAFTTGDILGFPKFMKAVKDKNWEQAAKEIKERGFHKEVEKNGEKTKVFVHLDRRNSALIKTFLH